MKKRIIKISAILLCMSAIAGIYFGLISPSLFGKPIRMRAYDSFETELKNKYDYIDNMKFRLGTKPKDIELSIRTNRDLSWNEIEELFKDNIVVYLTSDEMMQKIKEIWGDDPMNNIYPDIFVEIRFEKNAAYAVQFESSYYNTWDMIHLTQENVSGYTDWIARGSIVPDGEGAIKLN